MTIEERLRNNLIVATKALEDIQSTIDAQPFVSHVDLRKQLVDVSMRAAMTLDVLQRNAV